MPYERIGSYAWSSTTFRWSRDDVGGQIARSQVVEKTTVIPTRSVPYRRLHNHSGLLERCAASSTVTGSLQPRRIEARRMKKHTTAPAMVAGTSGQWKKY